jgi:hypothetical protein
MRLATAAADSEPDRMPTTSAMAMTLDVPVPRRGGRPDDVTSGGRVGRDGPACQEGGGPAGEEEAPKRRTSIGSVGSVG